MLKLLFSPPFDPIRPVLWGDEGLAGALFMLGTTYPPTPNYASSYLVSPVCSHYCPVRGGSAASICLLMPTSSSPDLHGGLQERHLEMCSCGQSRVSRASRHWEVTVGGAGRRWRWETPPLSLNVAGLHCWSSVIDANKIKMRGVPGIYRRTT